MASLPGGVDSEMDASLRRSARIDRLAEDIAALKEQVSAPAMPRFALSVVTAFMLWWRGVCESAALPLCAAVRLSRAPKASHSLSHSSRAVHPHALVRNRPPLTHIAHISTST